MLDWQASTAPNPPHLIATNGYPAFHCAHAFAMAAVPFLRFHHEA